VQATTTQGSPKIVPLITRGDLGVEVSIHEMAILQKQLIAKANLAGKPVITTTQILESMTSSRLLTRAEATDVANVFLDRTDCVMLSGESATGKFPEESVAMLAKIAAFTESHRPEGPWRCRRRWETLVNPKAMLVERVARPAHNQPCLEERDYSCHIQASLKRCKYHGFGKTPRRRL
jgi:pyruvate kinase